VSGKTITFSVGTDSGSALTSASGVATDTTTLTQNPAPPYIATATCPVVQCGVTLTITHVYDITQEDARATYTGAMFASTSSATSSTATVTLSATIQDITAVSGDSSSDPNAGDIRNATVKFVYSSTSTITASSPTACVPTGVGLVNLADLKTGTATCNWSIDIGSGDSVGYTIGIVVEGYYTRFSTSEATLVTVSKPLSNFITGGGRLVMSSSAGLYPGQQGTNNNFGFNVKYNKGGTNLQGNMNTIIRNGGRVYQIKGNSMTSLAVQPTPCPNATSTSPCTATFNGKGSIQDITDPLNVIPVDGNATLQVTMTDNGEPGSGDAIGITVWNKNGGLWFSSNWNGTKTVEQLLGGGNLVIH